MRSMQILYLRNWPTNIGNAFIDLGGLQCLKKALPEAEIHILGGLGRRLLHATAISKYQKAYLYYVHLIPFISNIFKRNMERSISKRHYRKIFMQTAKNITNFFDLSLALQAEFAVVSGCILTSQLGLFLSTLMNLKKRNRKIILNAVGGDSYSQAEIEVVREFLKELKPYAFISRDHEAFKNYHDLSEHSYDGIDAAFFLNDYFKPPKLQLPKYVVLTFDKQREPPIDVDCDLIIRTSHFTYPSIGGSIVRKIYRKSNLLISDNPKDYLIIYANAKEVHSDRVHACVATLSFGKPCRLYNKTKRALLLDRVGAGKVRKRLTTLDSERIKREKIKQIKFLKEIIGKR